MKMLRSGHRAGWMNGLAAAVLAGAGLAQAATLTWNGGVAGSWQGGGGGWLDGGGSAATWNSATPDAAVFGGLSAGSLTVDAGGVTVGDISVTNGTYFIDVGGTVLLSNTVFFVGDALTTTVGAALSGASSLVKTGPGTLVFTNVNKNHSGATIISGGVVRVLAAGAGSLGATATQSVVLAGGALHALFSTSTSPSNVITVGAQGGEIRNLGTDSQRWGINGNRIAGSGTLTLTFGSSGTRFQILTGQNNFTGKWVIDSDGNQSKFVDQFSSTAYGGVTGADAITLTNAGTILLRGITLGSSTQGVTLAGTAQARVSSAGGATSTIAAAVSGPSTTPFQLFAETASSVLIISNTANAWLGETTIAGLGIIRLGAAGVLPDTGGNVVINSTALLDLHGYDEALGGLFSSGRVDNRAAGSVVTLTVGGNNNSPTFSGIITNSGAGSVLSLVKSGTGTQTLSGTNYINGSVSVQAGTLALSSAADLAASTAVTVNAGATLLATGRSDGTFKVPAGQVLSGDGTVIGILTNEGVVAPGAPVGMLMQTGNFAQAASGELRVTITGASTHDQLRSSGSATLGGTLDVTLDGYAPVANDAFTVLRCASRTGLFGSTNLPALSAGLGWVVQYLSTGVVVAVTGAPPVSGYDLWAGSITNGLTNYYESATGDGYPNLLKYATGSSPTNADTLAALGVTRSGAVMSLLFNRNTNATDVTLMVEGSGGLAADAVWTGIATNSGGVWSPPSIIESGSGSPVAVTVPDTISTFTSRFLRVRVTRP